MKAMEETIEGIKGYITLLGISWGGSFLVIGFSVIPMILSAVASLLVAYKSYLEIKKLKNKS